MKVYLASPFFNEFEVMVRDRMQRKVMSHFREEFDDFEIFRPDLTPSSRSYSSAENGKERFALAKEIYKDNIEHINSCGILVFPADTTDLGTVFEVGYAISKGKLIYRYDYLSDELLNLNETMNLEEYKASAEAISPERIIINSIGKVAILGMVSEKRPAYHLEKGYDNIMLAAQFPYFDGERTIQPEDRDWEGEIL